MRLSFFSGQRSKSQPHSYPLPLQASPRAEPKSGTQEHTRRQATAKDQGTQLSVITSSECAFLHPFFARPSIPFSCKTSHPLPQDSEMDWACNHSAGEQVLLPERCWLLPHLPQLDIHFRAESASVKKCSFSLLYNASYLSIFSASWWQCAAAMHWIFLFRVITMSSACSGNMAT